MIPNKNTPPKILQTYFYDPDEATNIRVQNAAINLRDRNEELDRVIFLACHEIL